MTEQEAAVARICSHVCRSRPSLKLSMEACRKRKKLAESKFSPGYGFNPYWECRDCDGPLPREEKDKAMEGESKRRPSTRFNPRPCSQCGRTPEETRFYDSRPDRCVECIKSREKQLKASEPRTYTELDPNVSAEIDAQPDLPHHKHPDVITMSICRECGQSFEPYKNGVTVIKTLCKDCIARHHKDGIKKYSRSTKTDYEVTLDLTEEPELFEELVKMAKRERRTLTNQAIIILELQLRTQTGGVD